MGLASDKLSPGKDLSLERPGSPTALPVVLPNVLSLDSNDSGGESKTDDFEELCLT